ncbi:MAG TPA: heavy metal transport/detoxification protein [Clostridiales bacterium UBA8960]|nr:heavy metal transport/detoxification protein [Clostridiales bacterium UBA8960]
MKKTLLIEGMSCNHCKMRVEKALSDVVGIDGVAVDLATKTAVVTLSQEIEDAVLIEVIDDAGYDVVEVKVQ